MPISKREGKWYWGSKGPYNSRKQAEEVERAAYASGYGVQQKIEKIETGAPMDGTKRQLTVSEVEKRTKELNPEIVKHYLLDEAKGSTQSPRGKSKPPSAPKAHSHSHSHHLHKEDGGAGLGGTVFTSTDAGIFNPTFGEKKKRKKSGVERLADFVTDSSPMKLSQKLIKQEWAGAGGPGLQGPLKIDWKKRQLDEEDVQKVVEREGEQNQDSVAKDAKDKQRSVERTVEDIKDDEKEKELQLQYGFGSHGGQGDALNRANAKDILSLNPRDDEGEEEEENTIPEEDEFTYGKKLRKSVGWDMMFKSLVDEF